MVINHIEQFFEEISVTKHKLVGDFRTSEYEYYLDNMQGKKEKEQKKKQEEVEEEKKVDYVYRYFFVFYSLDEIPDPEKESYRLAAPVS